MQAYTRKIEPSRVIKIGETVMINDEDIRIRGEFPIGVVTGFGLAGSKELDKHEDYPRVLRVRIRKQGKNVEIVRPYQNFSLLEISENEIS